MGLTGRSSESLNVYRIKSMRLQSLFWSPVVSHAPGDTFSRRRAPQVLFHGVGLEHGLSWAPAPIVPRSRIASTTLLLVDDERTALAHGACVLEGLGYGVLTADSAGDALRILSDETIDCKLVLSAYHLPEMNGLVLGERVMNDGLDRVFFLAAESIDGTIESQCQSRWGRCFATLGKPYQQSELEATIKKVLMGCEWDDSEIYED